LPTPVGNKQKKKEFTKIFFGEEKKGESQCSRG
jgi:hypothetical protein